MFQWQQACCFTRLHGSENTWQLSETADRYPLIVIATKERGQATLPDLEIIGLARFGLTLKGQDRISTRPWSARGREGWLALALFRGKNGLTIVEVPV